MKYTLQKILASPKIKIPNNKDMKKGFYDKNEGCSENESE